MPSPILARADALMHRKRHHDGDLDEVPILTDAVDDDIPVLTDTDLTTLAGSRPEEAAPPTPFPATTHLDPSQLDQLAAALSSRLEQRLQAELPRLIDATIADFMAEYAKQQK